MDEAPSNLSQASTLQANREDSMNILDPEDEEEHTQEEDSSGSNEDEDDSQDEEEEEEEEDEDDQDDEEGEEGEEEEDDDDGSEMELDEDYPDMNASPLVRFERFDRDDDLIIEFDNMFSSPMVKVPILARLEALRDEELDERREKRRRQAAEDEAKGAERGPEDKEGPDAQDAASKAGTPSADVTPPEHSGTAGETPPPGPHRTLVMLEPTPTPPDPPPGAPQIPARPPQPPEHEEGGPGRPPQDAEATQMELSPAPTITSLSPERAEDSDALTAVSSQLEGSPMDTSSLASCTLEDPLAGISLPEGVDPSFLAALPDDIRREVLQNQLGIRPPARAPPSASPAPPVVANPGLTEVSPEFLAALPPAIQEEVLAQQRAEQQRRELAQATGSDAPMDPVTFIQTLPSELRRSVLEDMEDSVLAVMPPDIAAEAQALRREQEARQRQLMHERLFGHSSTSALSAILRSPAWTGRFGGRFGVSVDRVVWGQFWGVNLVLPRPAGSSVDSLLRLRGRLLLDHEALSCLLVLLFVDEPKLNTSRLHRVLRNLCYHAPTRGWVVRSLLSILQRSSESELCLETPRAPPGPGPGAEERPRGRGARGTPGSAAEPRGLDLLHRVESRSSGQLSWLSVSMDAALGCRTNIFQIQRVPGRKHTEKHAAAAGSAVHIHPQAAPVVCRHVLDTLIQLAKVFPSHFTQQRGRDPATTDPERDRGPPKSGGSPCPPPPPPGLPQPLHPTTRPRPGDDRPGTVALHLQIGEGGPGGAMGCQIGTLLAELREYNLEQQRRAQLEAPSPEGLPEEQPPSAKLKGKMQSRFDTAESVVIVASQKRALGGRELQLPSMSVLTSKTSTQRFFLRVLQVIIQLRDDTRRAHRKAKPPGRLGAGGLGAAGSIQAAVRQLEAEADAIIQMVREGQRARRRQRGDT
ncbi:PREDICTED: E3 ubiquitin-protein ligase HUWE1-like, partial [Lepidothrix coronata]|uniref:E3 ubiquitin-protein ligase HUWE1-like n=1 Tax=Lepidothrix coronata TaxID=321398 RepID=A0A6J0J906_9PASS